MSLFGNFFGTEPQQITTNQSQNQTYTPSAATLQGANDTYGWLSTAMAQPYSNMPMQQISGFTPDQMAAFEATRAAQGQANPWFRQAGDLVTSGAGFSPDAVAATYGQLSSPVFASMADQFGAQMHDVTGNLRSAAGGTGADRIGVGQANLAKEQGLAMGQTGSSLLQQAINTELQKRQMQQSAGTLMGSLGGQLQGLRYQDIANLYGMGGQQQQLSQAQLDAMYQYGLGQFMYPSQLAQMGAGITSGLAPALGGTTTGTGESTKTVPAQPFLTTLAGLGMTGLGAAGTLGWKPFSAAGGRVDPYSILDKYTKGGMVPHYEDGGDIPFDERWAPATELLGGGSMEDRLAPVDYASAAGPFRAALPKQENPFTQQIADRSIKLDPGATDKWRAGVASDDELPSIMTAGMRPTVGVPGYAKEEGDPYNQRSPRTSFGVPIPSMPDLDRLRDPDKSGEIYRNPWMAMMGAGLGTLASIGKRTGEGFLEYPGIAAVAKGGLHGVEMLREQQKSALEEKRAELELEKSLESARHWRTGAEQTNAAQALKREEFERPYDQMTAAEKERYGIAKDQLAQGRYSYIGPQLDDDGNVTGSIFMDAKKGEPVVRDIKIGAKGPMRPLSPTLQKDLETKANNYHQLHGMQNAWNDSFSDTSFKQVGDIKNWITRQFAKGDKERAVWWQDYERYKANVRHALYGAALTKYEIEQWDRQDINPGMDPEIIKRNMAAQTKIVEGAIRRRADSLIKQGQPKRAIEAQLGVKIDDLPQPIEEPKKGGAPGGGAGTSFKPPAGWFRSPSTGQYRDPAGQMYDQNGNPI